MICRWIFLPILLLGAFRVTGEENRIAFIEVDVNSGSSVISMDLDTQSIVKVTGPLGAMSPTDLTWSPDGKKLAMATIAGIYVVDYHTGGLPVLLVPGPGAIQPEWSPDGSRIAFTQYNSGTDWGYEVRVANADGSGPVTVARGAFCPTWSPDGQRLAFSSYEPIPSLLAARSDIWVCDSDGSNARQITTSPFISAMLDWSPDGRRILFSGAEEGNVHVEYNGTGAGFNWTIYQLYTVDMSDGKQTQLTHIADSSSDRESILDSVWSPAGDRVAFVNGANIWLMDADGSNRVLLMKRTVDKLY